jgi:hypothetical protein
MRDNNRPKLILAEHLPELPNWLPFSTTSPKQADRNLMALMNVAQARYGRDFGEWLNGVDNAYAGKLRRVEDANLWPEQAEDEPSPRRAGMRRAA